jgi:putative endonuclease
MWFVYVLYNRQADRYYVGCTQDLKRRLGDHNRKDGTRWCGRQKGEWVLAHSEEFFLKEEALRREKEIKRRKSRAYIETLIKQK